VTSVASLAGELTAFGTYAAWAAGGAVGVAILVLVIGIVLPRCFRPAPASAQPVERTTV
jgi:hypothetical protein